MPDQDQPKPNFREDLRFHKDMILTRLLYAAGYTQDQVSQIVRIKTYADAEAIDAWSKTPAAQRFAASIKRDDVDGRTDPEAN